MRGCVDHACWKRTFPTASPLLGNSYRVANVFGGVSQAVGTPIRRYVTLRYPAPNVHPGVRRTEA